MAAVIGVTERVTPADVVLTLNFPTKKKEKTQKAFHRATVQRWPGSGAWGFFFGEAADAPQTPATPVCFSAGQS